MSLGIIDGINYLTMGPIIHFIRQFVNVEFWDVDGIWKAIFIIPYDNSLSQEIHVRNGLYAHHWNGAKMYFLIQMIIQLTHLQKDRIVT